MSNPESFEPILLNLAEDANYVVLEAALSTFASEADHAAEREDERVRYNGLPASTSDAPSWRGQAARARRLLEEIETQLDANGRARRAVRE